MLGALALTFTNMADASTVLSPAQKQQVATELERGRRGDVQHAARGAARATSRQTSRRRSSASTRRRGPIALQVALLVPLLAGLLGLGVSPG